MGPTPVRRPARRMVVALVSALVVAAVALGVVTGAFGAIARRGLYATGLWTAGGATTIAPGTFDSPVPPAPATATATAEPTPTPTAGLPSPVLVAARPRTGADRSAVTTRLDAVDRSAVKGTFSGTVIEVGTGSVLYAHRATAVAIPASTMKLLTSATALSILGPEHRFATRAVSAGRGKVVLVGGGDPYLARRTAVTYPERASIADLAAGTATELKRTGQRTVSLRYDDSLFTGPAWNPTWLPGYGDQVTPVSALWVDEGRVNGGSPGPRVADPSASAAKAFVAALEARGITVTSTKAGRAAKNAPVLASVSSMPLERIVEQLLLASDNDAAEVLFRQAAIGAKRPGSFAEGAEVVRQRLTALGVWDAGTEVHDGSGLSRQTRVPADTMAKVLRLGADDRRPELRALITGLPVAGVEGSLRIRFFDDASLPGRGLVRAKTGTLRKVHALAGFVRTRDGSLLVYAFLVNDAKNDYAAQVWLDRVTTALSGCGCPRR